jgi:hypothetical protein
VACLVAQLQQTKVPSTDSKSLVSSDGNKVDSSKAKVGTELSPAESLAESCVGGVVSSLTTTDVKGTESDDNLMSCMFVVGEKLQTARRKPQFLDNYNSLPKFALTSHEGLPSSLSHMVKMLYDDLEELRVFSDFLPQEMVALVEREIGRFVSLMSSLWVSLVDSSDTTVCYSHEGIWRGLIHLFYHQYMDAFSSSERGLFQTFYPEMLCNSFDVNSAYLLRHYSWRSAQLTGFVHNYIRSSCPRCMQSSCPHRAVSLHLVSSHAKRKPFCMCLSMPMVSHKQILSKLD